jgi:sugar phosphate isomerase/epimerase
MPLGLPGEPRHGFDAHPQALSDTKRALQETGVRLLDVEVALIREDLDMGVYRTALEQAAELGCRFVLANVYTADTGVAADRLAELCDLAAPLGLAVALEPVSFSSLATVAAAVGLVRRVQRSNATILPDALHVHFGGETPALATLPADRVRYVHLCDAPIEIPDSLESRRRIARGGRLLPGEGAADLVGLVRALPAGIVYAVEAPNPERLKRFGAERYARLAADATRQVLRQAFGVSPAIHRAPSES